MFLNLLQASYEGQNHLLANLTTSEAFLMVIIVGVVGMIVQWRLRSVVSKYSKEPMPGGFTGAEIAQKMLRENGVTDVSVVHTGGYLTDHFNPLTKTVNLSDEVYYGRSITAAAIACHECGHAVQHAMGYAPLKLRSALVPLVQFSSQAASWLVIIGLIMTASSGSQMMCWMGVGLMCISALFSIITLPVEYNASDRAIAWLQSSGMMQGAELDNAREALSWAARTYLVAALSAIATLLYYVSIIMRRK